MESIVQAVIIGLITGIFSAGSMLIVLKTEFKYLRRDVDELREGLRNHANMPHTLRYKNEKT